MLHSTRVPISPDLVQHLKLCTVAICLDLGPNIHPKVLGTGFSINNEGYILTNSHVAMALLTPLEYWHTLQLSPRSCVVAYQFFPGKGMGEIKAGIKGIFAVTGKIMPPGAIGYGGPPDLSIVATEFKSTPNLNLSQDPPPPEGTEVYFCGFPLGEHLLFTEHGREQVTSTLQHGIISAHLPFSGIPNPHGFLIDATCNPGNSGSPLINPANGEVVGVVYAKRTEAFTYAVSAHGIGQLLAKTIELDKAGTPPQTSFIQFGKPYAPPAELQSDIVKQHIQKQKEQEGKKHKGDPE